jgi:hypothetical protein
VETGGHEDGPREHRMDKRVRNGRIVNDELPVTPQESERLLHGQHDLLGSNEWLGMSCPTTHGAAADFIVRD